MAHNPIHELTKGPKFIPPTVRPTPTVRTKKSLGVGTSRPGNLAFRSIFPQPGLPPDQLVELYRNEGIPRKEGFTVDPAITTQSIRNYAPEFQALVAKHPAIIDPKARGGGYTYGAFVDRQSLGSPLYLGQYPGEAGSEQVTRHELGHIGIIEILAGGDEDKLNQIVSDFQSDLWKIAETIPEEMQGQVFDPSGSLGNFQTENDFLQWLQMWGVEGGAPIGGNPDEPHIDLIPGELHAEITRWSGGDINVVPKPLQKYFEGILTEQRPESFQGELRPTVLPKAQLFRGGPGFFHEDFEKFLEQYDDISIDRPVQEDEIIFAGRMIPKDDFTDAGLMVAERQMAQLEEQIALNEYQNQIRDGFNQFKKIQSGEFEVTGQVP